jgi:hypothetical protein
MTGISWSSMALAGWYSISMEATIGARKPIHGKVKVLEGQEGIVSTPDTEIKLVPTSSGPHRWKIQVEAYRKTSTGLQKVSNSALIVREGTPAELSQSTEDGQLLFRIKLTLKKAQ